MSAITYDGFGSGAVQKELTRRGWDRIALPDLMKGFYPHPRHLELTRRNSPNIFEGSVGRIDIDLLASNHGIEYYQRRTKPEAKLPWGRLWYMAQRMGGTIYLQSEHLRHGKGLVTAYKIPDGFHHIDSVYGIPVDDVEPTNPFREERSIRGFLRGYDS